MFRKLIASAVLLAALVVGAQQAHAATAAELQAQIDALLAQIAGLQGGSSSSSCYAFTRDLTVGAQGADVTALQNYLAGKGFFSVAATGYFGPITQSSVSAWQAANGVAPAVGYFGAISRAKYNSMCSTGPVSSGDDDDDDDDDSGFFGGNDEGYLDEFDQLSKYSSEEVGEDEEDVPVLGIEFEAVDSDQMIERVVVRFDTPAGSSPSDDLDDYIQDVSLWLDGEEIGRMDVDEASHTKSTDTYTFRFINLEGVVSEDDVANLLVAVTGVGNLDSGSQGDGWTVTIPADGIRASSPNGVVDEYDTSAYDEPFTLETFASATGLELKAKKSSDSPDAGIVNVDDEDDTDGVELLRFTLEADGGDVNISEIPITLTTVGGANLAAIANRVILTVDGDEYSETASTTGTAATTTFDNLDIDIADGDELEFVVSVDVNDIAAGTFDEGDTLKAEFTADNRIALEAEDETGEDLGASDKTGTALGDEQSFYDVGIMVSLVSVDADYIAQDGNSNDSAQFEIVFDVEAFDGTVYLSDEAVPTIADPVTATLADDNLYLIEQGGTPTVTGVTDSLSFTTNDGAALDTGNIALADGESTRITLTMAFTADHAFDAGFYQAFLAAIAWNTDNGDGAGQYNAYIFNLDDYKTGTVNVVN